MKELLTKFFELKAEQMLGALYLQKYQQVGYTQDDVDLMFKVLNVRSALEQVTDELKKLIMDNVDFFYSMSADRLEKEAPNYKVSEARQKELSKARYNMELSVDTLV